MRLLEIIATALERFIFSYTCAHKFASSAETGQLREDITDAQEKGETDLDIADTLRMRVDVLEARVVQAHEALGGQIWRMEGGCTRYITELSTDHLQNIIKGGFGSPNARTAIRDELERRTLDKAFRATEEPETPSAPDFLLASSVLMIVLVTTFITLHHFGILN